MGPVAGRGRQRGSMDGSLLSHCNEVVNCSGARAVLSKPLRDLTPGQLRCAPVISAQLHAASTLRASLNELPWLPPEPWNGHLGTARLLFVGQNPSANHREDYPSSASKWRKDRLLHFFEGRFDGGVNAPIFNGTRVRLQNGGHGKANPFLTAALKYARRLYGHGRRVRPGMDYALTEAVRCKAADAIGVHQAVESCARNFLQKTLMLSGATVIVCLGSMAHRAFALATGVTERAKNLPFTWKAKTVVFLAHPNSQPHHGRRELTEAASLRLRRRLGAVQRSPRKL